MSEPLQTIQPWLSMVTDIITLISFTGIFGWIVRRNDPRSSIASTMTFFLKLCACLIVLIFMLAAAVFVGQFFGLVLDIPFHAFIPALANSYNSNYYTQSWGLTLAMIITTVLYLYICRWVFNLPKSLHRMTNKT